VPVSGVSGNGAFLSAKCHGHRCRATLCNLFGKFLGPFDELGIPVTLTGFGLARGKAIESGRTPVDRSELFRAGGQTKATPKVREMSSCVVVLAFQLPVTWLAQERRRRVCRLATRSFRTRRMPS
jgi:hypothetical protein